MTTINGLPAHALLVHAVVVLVPLTALLLVLGALWPPARRRLSSLTAVLATLSLVAVPITTEAGDWLEHHVERSDLVHTHTQLGDGLLTWVAALFLVAVLVAGRELVQQRRQRSVDGPGAAVATTARRIPVGGRAVTAVLAALAIAVGTIAVVDVYRIGESGARAAWTGHFSDKQLWGKPRG